LHTGINDALTIGTTHLHLNNTIVKPQKEIPWMVGMITLEVSPFLSTVVFPSSLLTNDNQPKAFVVTIGYHVVNNNNISVNRMTKNLEGNTRKYTGSGNITV
jgi:hypothetical protein